MSNFKYDTTYEEYSLWDAYGPMPWDTIDTRYYPHAEASLRHRNERDYGGSAEMFKRTIRVMSTDYEEVIDVDTERWEGEGGR